MSDEQLTAEEQTALEAMETDKPIDIKEPEKEPEAAEEKAPEPETKEPEFKSTRTEEKPPEGFVPHQAMHSERMRRQEAERKLEEYDKRFADLEAKVSPQEQPPQYVDPLVDPEGFRRWSEFNNDQATQAAKRVQEQIAQQAQMQQRVVQASQFEQEYAAKVPDYQQAAQYVQAHRQTELQGMGYSPQQVAEQMAKDANGLFDAAVAANLNPAELIYAQAQQRGYQKPQEAPQAGPTEAEKVVALAEAQRATEGVGTSGAPQEGKLTVAALADMSEDELDKLSEADFRKVMGG